MTDDQRREIHNAMQAAGGRKVQAAKLLGVEAARLHNAIHRDRELRARWTKPRKSSEAPPESALTIHRPNESCYLNPDTALAKAMAFEDRAVRENLASIGITGERLARVVALQKLQRHAYRSSLEIMGGGMTARFLDLQNSVEKLNGEIDRVVDQLENPSGNGHSAEQVMALVAREELLRKDRAALIELEGKAFDRSSSAALKQAIIKNKLEGKKHQPSSRPKGFLAIQAQPGSNVKVTMPNAGTEPLPLGGGEDYTSPSNE